MRRTWRGITTNPDVKSGQSPERPQGKSEWFACSTEGSRGRGVAGDHAGNPTPV